MKKILLSIAAFSFVFASTAALAQTAPDPATAAAPAAGSKHVKPAAKGGHHKHHKKAKAEAK